jgi:cardiolipin synthase A/B
MVEETPESAPPPAEAGSPKAGAIAPEQARSLVEAVLGKRPARRPLAVDFAPATTTSWELLIDGPAFFPKMLADIEAARSDVHIIIFGFKAGEIGDRFRDALIKKVSEGVAVRLMVDAGYSQPGLGSRKLYGALRAGGVQVVANQGAFLDLDGLLGSRRIDWRFDDLGHFDHRKVVVIDGLVAYAGGPGIEDHFNDERFHDVMLRMEGPIVAQLQAVCLLSWHFQGGPLPETPAELDRFFPEQPTGDGVRMEILLNNPGEGHLPIVAAYKEAIAGARRRLYVINPYLADRAIIRAIIRAARRGVDVRVIVPADPKSLPASGAVRHWFAELTEAGVDLREHPHMAHAKVLVSDDTVLAGTANLDGLSLRRNWELMVRANDKAFADHVAHELFDRDLLISAPARMPTGRRERALNAAMSVLSPLF